MIPLSGNQMEMVEPRSNLDGTDAIPDPITATLDKIATKLDSIRSFKEDITILKRLASSREKSHLGEYRCEEKSHSGVDVALTGSQKALSLPIGVGIVCASPKAIEASQTAKSLRVFFDWKDYLKFYKLGTYWPYIPSLQLLYGLRATLDLIFEEGSDNVIARHTRLGTVTRLAVEAWGLKNYTQKEEWFSDPVTAVVVPPYIDSFEVVRRAWKRYNLSLGLGLNKVAGKSLQNRTSWLCK